MYSHLQMPMSMVVPAYNEAATIANSVRALLQLRYQHFEVIVVNDGSKDDTLAVLQREFQLAAVSGGVPRTDQDQARARHLSLADCTRTCA